MLVTAVGRFAGLVTGGLVVVQFQPTGNEVSTVTR
jgi:hypothetical protein